MNDLEKRYEMEEEIDILEFLRTLAIHKKLIIMTTIIMMVIVTLGGKLYNNSKRVNKVIISFNYNGISEGKNPDSSTFNEKEIIPLSIYKKVYDENKDNLKESNFTDFIDTFKISGVIPANIKTQMENAKKDGKTFFYTPTQYEISTKNNEKILTSIVDDSINNFKNQYTPIEKLNKLNNNNNNIDYSDRYLILLSEINKIQTIMNDRNKNTFISNKYGFSMKKINLELDNIKRIDLRSYYSYYDLNNLSLKSGMKNIITTNKIKDLNENIAATREKIKIIKGLLDNYKPTSKNYIISPSGQLQNTNSSIDLNSQTDLYYKELVDKYIALNNDIINTKKDINRLQKELDDKYVLPTEKQEKTINAIYSQIIDKLNVIIDEVNEINAEYIKVKYSDMIKIDSPIIEATNGKPLIFFLAGGIVIGLFLGIFMAFGLEFKKEYDKRYTK